MKDYETYQIDPEWVLETEQLGTKDKFWFKCTDDSCSLFDSAEWLFKYPTEGTGQHWSEKIAFHLARAMRVFAPQVELAEFAGIQGSATRSFTSANNYELYHGNQILKGFDPNYDDSMRFGQNDHTIQRIFEAFGGIFVEAKSGEDARSKMAGYLVFDALICNVDRHHENWGVLRKRNKKGQWEGRFAPSYDHASSLGRELKDQNSKRNRERYLKDLGVRKYIEKGHGSVFVDGTGKRGPSPLRLIERCLEIDGVRPYFLKGLQKLDNLDEARVEAIIAAVPADWMSELAREFALALVVENLKLLNELRT
jgi:hypothetical protein